VIIPILVLVAAVSAGGPAESPPLALSPGPHAVGFLVLAQRDAERRLDDGALRPVQVGVWYPAVDSSLPPMRYRDYVLVSAGERSLDVLSPAAAEDALARYRAVLQGHGLSRAGIEDWLAAPLLARTNAPAAAGRWPLVLIAAGTGGAVQDQAVLGESLASHGYVVATTPSPLRLGSRMESESDVPAMAEEQARDLEIALSATAPRAMVDASRVGLVGYSFGARPALLLAGRHPSIRALVSLDGGIGSADAKGWLAPRALDRAALRTPILHVYEEADEEARPDFTLLASLSHAPRMLARAEGLGHLDFITLGLASASLSALGGPDDHKAAALRAVFAVTAAFLDAHVRGDPAAWTRLVAGAAAASSALVHVTPFGRAPASPRPRGEP
jgi:dienelactone hydrolase